MAEIRRIVLLVWCGAAAVAVAQDPGQASGWPHPLFATEMYAKYGASLEHELAAAGRTSHEAEYAAFWITADIAQCAAAALAAKGDPGVEFFLWLLAEEQTYDRVIDELARSYSANDFWQLMATIDAATAACFEESFRALGLLGVTSLRTNLRMTRPGGYRTPTTPK